MWEVSFGKMRGVIHERYKMKCQDQVYHKEKNEMQVIVLADGCGDSDINVNCVSEVVEYTANRMIEVSEEYDLWKLPKDQMLNLVMSGVIQIISKYMDEKKLPAKYFASTLLVTVIDEKTERYLLMHLGDGIIISKNGNGTRILSYPRGSGSKTYLTISENLQKHIQVRYGKIGSIDQIAMCSDGVYQNEPDTALRALYESEIGEILKKEKLYKQQQDDQSFIQLRRK